MSNTFLTTTNGHKVLFSDEDTSIALANTWTMTTDGYAKRFYEKNIAGKRVRWVKYFHREVMGAEDGQIVDHINGNKLDNRKSNLRIASKSLNALNTKKYKGSIPHRGVIFNKQAGKYQARITFNKKSHHLGFFTDPLEASATYINRQKELTNVI